MAIEYVGEGGAFLHEPRGQRLRTLGECVRLRLRLLELTDEGNIRDRGADCNDEAHDGDEICRPYRVFHAGYLPRRGSRPFGQSRRRDS